MAGPLQYSMFGDIQGVPMLPTLEAVWSAPPKGGSIISGVTPAPVQKNPAPAGAQNAVATNTVTTATAPTLPVSATSEGDLPIPSTPSDPTATLSFGNPTPPTTSLVDAAAVKGILKDKKISLPHETKIALQDHLVVSGNALIASGSVEDGSVLGQVNSFSTKARVVAEGGTVPDSVPMGADVDFVTTMLLNQRKVELDAIRSNTLLSDSEKKDKIQGTIEKFDDAVASVNALAVTQAPGVISSLSTPNVGGDVAPIQESFPQNRPLSVSGEPVRYVTTSAIGYPTTVKLVDASGNAYDIPTVGGQVIKSLVLGMSPETLTVNSTKLINRYQTLTRWVEEHWGDELDQVSFSGSSFGFVTSDGYFLTPERREAGAYKELRYLVDLYKQNGGVYQEANDPSENRRYRYFYNPVDINRTRVNTSHPRAGMLRKRLYVQLAFDFAIFTGYFESFTIDDDATRPFTLQYSASFKAESTQWT